MPRNLPRPQASILLALAAVLLGGCGPSSLPRRASPPEVAARAPVVETGCRVLHAAQAGASSGPPGVVVFHSPASSGRYIGSPSIELLDDGTLVASHDIFGPQRPEPRETHVYRSSDGGWTWRRAGVVQSQFWSNLFAHRGALYLLGTTTGLGALVVRRSTDGGFTWSEASGPDTGLLAEGRFHTAPVPMIVHGGRVWRAVEELLEPGEWPGSLSPFVMSAPETADLLDARSWTRTPALRFDAAGPGVGWMEGNIVRDARGELFVVLRVDVRGEQERAAMLRLRDGALVVEGFPDFPGGSKKFTIRYDEQSRLYWTLVNDVEDEPARLPAALRNRLSIASSADLREWTLHRTLLSHPDARHHGFQYADFRFDGDDLVFVSRTAFGEGEDRAADYHNANYLTFHRVARFRDCASSTDERVTNSAPPP